MQTQPNTKTALIMLAIIIVPAATALIIAYNVLPKESFLPHDMIIMFAFIIVWNIIAFFINIKVQKWLTKRKQIKQA